MHAVVLADIFVLQEITYLFFVLKQFDKLHSCVYLFAYILTYLFNQYLFIYLLIYYWLRRARLVLEWVTVSGFNSRCRTFISVSEKPPMSTQPGHPFVSKRPVKGRWRLAAGKYRQVYGLCLGGRWNCVIPLLHMGHLWALQRWRTNKFTCLILLTFTYVAMACLQFPVRITSGLRARKRWLLRSRIKLSR